MDHELELRNLLEAVASRDRQRCDAILQSQPALARARCSEGATRTGPGEYFLEPIRRYLVEGDTALHIAAAAYNAALVERLLALGAEVNARNRLGDEPLHSAAVGSPGSAYWNPQAQAETIRVLAATGADPNARDRFGVTPLHRAVRTRCSLAVKTLLDCGADPAIRNKNGSDATTGRTGSGSPDARAEQQKILEILQADALRR